MDQETIQAFIDAAVKDQKKAREMLKKEPSLLNARYIHDETVLHFLAVENYAEGVEFLAQAGADVDATNQFGDTVLIDAAWLGNAEVVRSLLKHRANPDAQSITHDNALHSGGRSGNPEVLDALLSAGAKSDYVTDLCETIWDAVAYRPKLRESMEAVLIKYKVTRLNDKDF